MIGTTAMTTIAIRMVSLGTSCASAPMLLALLIRKLIFCSMLTSTNCSGNRSERLEEM